MSFGSNQPGQPNAIESMRRVFASSVLSKPVGVPRLGGPAKTLERCVAQVFSDHLVWLLARPFERAILNLQRQPTTEDLCLGGYVPLDSLRTHWPLVGQEHWKVGLLRHSEAVEQGQRCQAEPHRSSQRAPVRRSSIEPPCHTTKSGAMRMTFPPYWGAVSTS